MPHEWRTYRDLRLRALADAPDAFGSTLADEGTRPDREWATRLQAGIDRQRNLPLLAEAGTEPVGLAWGRIHDSSTDVANLYQMWVAPTHRRMGIGELLLNAVIVWARTLKARRVVLSVTSGNSPAYRMYIRAGFKSVGEPVALRPGSSVSAQPMQLVLTDDAA
jgi:ribosomal protein S18 acetylase RimI-like enzyme